MPTAEDVLYFARRYIGTEESPPSSNRTIFGEWYGVNSVPWCAIFVSYCFYRARLQCLYGIEPTDKPGFAYCPYGVAYFKEHHKLDLNPQKGDVVFFDWDSDGISDHVGILEEILSDTQFRCIEGNTGYQNDSNGGSVMRRIRKIQTIVGFAHPDYDNLPLNPHLDNAPSWPGYLITLTSPVQKGPDIQQWQERMIELGYNLGAAGADSIFGPISYAALKQLQQDRHLKVDGILGSMTWDETWS